MLQTKKERAPRESSPYAVGMMPITHSACKDVSISCFTSKAILSCNSEALTVLCDYGKSILFHSDILLIILFGNLSFTLQKLSFLFGNKDTALINQYPLAVLQHLDVFFNQGVTVN